MTDTHDAATPPARRGFLVGAAAAAAGTAVLAMPNVSRAQTVTLRFQSTWPQRDIFHEFAGDFVSRVNAMAGGRPVRALWRSDGLQPLDARRSLPADVA